MRAQHKTNAFALIAAMAVMACVALAPANAWAKKTIGVIMTGDIAYYQEIHNEVMKGLKAGGDFEVVVQTPAPNPMSWTNAARKLVVLGSDVIIAYGAPATLTVMKETSSIPILFAGVYDPLSMNMEGKNATGISSKVSMEDLIKMLKKIVDFKSLGVVFSKTEKDTILQVKEIKKFEDAYGFTTTLLNSGDEGMNDSLTGLNALLLTTSCSSMCSVVNIMKTARQDKLPTAASIGGAEGLGVLITTKASTEEQGQKVAGMAIKVLGGAAPASIPILNPEKIEVIINLKAAKEMGLQMPGDLIKMATKVME